MYIVYDYIDEMRSVSFFILEDLKLNLFLSQGCIITVIVALTTLPDFQRCKEIQLHISEISTEPLKGVF